MKSESEIVAHAQGRALAITGQGFPVLLELRADGTVTWKEQRVD